MKVPLNLDSLVYDLTAGMTSKSKQAYHLKKHRDKLVTNLHWSYAQAIMPDVTSIWDWQAILRRLRTYEHKVQTKMSTEARIYKILSGIRRTSIVRIWRTGERGTTQRYRLNWQLSDALGGKNGYSEFGGKRIK